MFILFHIIFRFHCCTGSCLYLFHNFHIYFMLFLCISRLAFCCCFRPHTSHKHCILESPRISDSRILGRWSPGPLGHWATGPLEFGQFGQFGLRIPEESASPHFARRVTIERLPSGIAMRAFRFARQICFTQNQIHDSKVVNNPRSKHFCCCSVKLNAADLSKKFHKRTVHMAHPADGVDESCTSLVFATSGVLKGTRINLKVGISMRMTGLASTRTQYCFSCFSLYVRRQLSLC